MAKKLNKSDKPRLSGKRLQLAELLANPEFVGTNKDMYESVGISHDTFYKWLKDEAFMLEVERLVDKYTNAELASIWKALIGRARIGDMQAIKLYFELKGRYNQSVTIDGDMELNITIDYGDGNED